MKYNYHINNELIEADEQRVDTEQKEIYNDDTEAFNDICKQADFDFKWQHPKRLYGRERYLALCKKLGLKAK